MVMILEQLEPEAAAGWSERGYLEVGGALYWLCPTRISGRLETWLAPRDVWREMVGPPPPLGFVSADMCSIVPERVGCLDAWVACYWHDFHYEMWRRGELSRWLADFYFARNAYREIRARQRPSSSGRIRRLLEQLGAEAIARVAQARAWGTNLGGWIPGPLRIPLGLLAAAGVVWWARACYGGTP